MCVYATCESICVRVCVRVCVHVYMNARACFCVLLMVFTSSQGSLSQTSSCFQSRRTLDSKQSLAVVVFVVCLLLNATLTCTVYHGHGSACTVVRAATLR